MSLVPLRPRGPEDEKEAATLVLDIREEVQRLAWAQAARWRAAALAEEVFGAGVVPTLRHARNVSGYQALVELTVPFHDLDLHRELEDEFVAAASVDEVLSRVPTVYLFTARERECGADDASARDTCPGGLGGDGGLKAAG